MLEFAQWKGVATLHALLSESGYNLPTAYAETTLGVEANTESVAKLMTVWATRGDAVLSHARTLNPADVNRTFAKAIERHDETRSPLERSQESREPSYFQAQRRRLYEIAEAEAALRRIRAQQLVRKSDVKAMLLDEYAEYGLSKIKKPDFIPYPAIAFGLHWGGGLISLAFDLGGRAQLAGRLPFEFWITWADGSIACLGDCRYLSPGISEYFTFVRASTSAEGVMTIDQSPTLATYAVRVALDLPRLLAQTF